MKQPGPQGRPAVLGVYMRRRAAGCGGAEADFGDQCAPATMQLGSLALICLSFAMFLFVYIILLGGSDFHERDCIGFLFNKLMGTLGLLPPSVSHFDCV